MGYSSDEGDAKNGKLVKEAYEYLVRNVYPVGASVALKRCIRRKAQKFVVRGGEMYFKKKNILIWLMYTNVLSTRHG